MFKKILWTYFSIVTLCFSLCAHAENDHAKKAVQHAYYQWCKSIGMAKGNPAIVVRHYAYDALLIPTLSADFLVNRNGGLNAYFKKLTSHQDMKCTPETLRTYVHGIFATNSGIYRFSFKENNGTKIIPARFTFIYKNINGHWMIIEHHSSKMPE